MTCQDKEEGNIFRFLYSRMGCSFSHKTKRMYIRMNPPFDIQIPSSLQDPCDKIFSVEELEHLRTVNDARNIALEYLHDDKEFASFWNSYRPNPETRRLMRKLVQIQTINAVGNGFENKINKILFSHMYFFFQVLSIT